MFYGLANVPLILVASALLVWSVKYFIKAASNIAEYLGISHYTISFLVVAIATSLPELVVAITSAVDKNPILSFGNVIGSNIALVTLVIAIPILIGTPIYTKSKKSYHDIYVATLLAFAPIALGVDGMLTRLDGAILMGTYTIYILMVLRRSKGLELIMEKLIHKNMWKQTAILVSSLALLLVSSEVIVQSAVKLSLDIGISIAFIGISLTAIGTSLPELAFTVAASKESKKSSKILGDIVGSIAANSTLVIGITSVIRPINLTDSNFGVTTIVSLIFIFLVFLRFAKTKHEIDKKEAFILILLYFGFLAVEAYIQSAGMF